MSEEHVKVIMQDLETGLKHVLPKKDWTPKMFDKARLNVLIEDNLRITVVSIDDKQWTITNPDFFGGNNSQDIDKAYKELGCELFHKLEDQQEKDYQKHKSKEEQSKLRAQRNLLKRKHIMTPLQALRALAYYCLITGHKVTCIANIDNEPGGWTFTNCSWQVSGSTIADRVVNPWPITGENLLQIKDFSRVISLKTNPVKKDFAKKIRDLSSFVSLMKSWGLYVEKQ